MFFWSLGKRAAYTSGSLLSTSALESKVFAEDYQKDPNVLENCGIDSKVYSGYALGMGIERITNLKYQVKDLRMFSENDVRFLREFESAN